MTDIKLFRTTGQTAEELSGTAVALEKSLQVLMEQNLETLLGVTFLASEYSNGPKHGGRIDVAFKRIKNFACVEVRPTKNALLMFLKVDPDGIELEEGFTRDVRNIGHFGTGDLEVTLANQADLEKAKALIQASYDAS